MPQHATNDATFVTTSTSADEATNRSDRSDRTSPDYIRTKALLECWSEWRGTALYVLLRHMQPRCTLGRWVKSARQGGELWAHNERQGRVGAPVVDDTLNDDLMSLVDRAVCNMPTSSRNALWVTYVTHRHAPVAKRCRKLGVSRTTYYRHLEAGHQAVDRAVEQSVGWRNVLVC